MTQWVWLFNNLIRSDLHVFMKLSFNTQTVNIVTSGKARSLVWSKSRYVCTLNYTSPIEPSTIVPKVYRRVPVASIRFITTVSSVSRGLLTQQSGLYRASKSVYLNVNILWGKIILQLYNLFNFVLNLNSIALCSILFFKPVSRSYETKITSGSAKRWQSCYPFAIKNIKLL
jgi:hypothetical protein